MGKKRLILYMVAIICIVVILIICILCNNKKEKIDGISVAEAVVIVQEKIIENYSPYVVKFDFLNMAEYDDEKENILAVGNFTVANIYAYKYKAIIYKNGTIRYLSIE